MTREGDWATSKNVQNREQHKLMPPGTALGDGGTMHAAHLGCAGTGELGTGELGTVDRAWLELARTG